MNTNKAAPPCALWHTRSDPCPKTWHYIYERWNGHIYMRVAQTEPVRRRYTTFYKP